MFLRNVMEAFFNSLFEIQIHVMGVFSTSFDSANQHMSTEANVAIHLIKISRHTAHFEFSTIILPLFLTIEL